MLNYDDQRRREASQQRFREMVWKDGIFDELLHLRIDQLMKEGRLDEFLRQHNVAIRPSAARG